MKRVAKCMITVALCGCATHIVAQPTHEAETFSAHPDLHQMKEGDARLRSRFEEIQIGMSHDQVRAIMGVDPQVDREDVWAFPLSYASNSATEIDWILLVSFENGTVKNTQTTYTCLYRTEKD